jgi:tetratricopeptide (TPR) repeat protein
MYLDIFNKNIYNFLNKMLPLKDLAIQKALQNDWEGAILLNEQILKERPLEIETLNRLGYAYIKFGELQKAKKVFEDVLKIDRTNPIALKNLKKIYTLLDQKPEDYCRQNNGNQTDMMSMFIEEAGKTKIVELKNVADKRTLSLLQIGDELSLVIKRSKIFIQSGTKYIGMLPDHVGIRLVPFIKGGNEYKACVRSVDDKSVLIFIKEQKRAARFKSQPSFAASSIGVK